MKKEYQGQCIFCGEPISSNQAGVGYTKTKRKTVTLFHEDCYEMYCKGCEEKSKERYRK